MVNTEHIIAAKQHAGIVTVRERGNRFVWGVAVTTDSHLGGVLSGGAPTGPVTSPDHAPCGGIAEGIQVSGGACWEGPASVGIPQLQSAAWQRATGIIEGEIRWYEIR